MKKKRYKVSVFVLGTPPEVTKEIRIIEANSVEEAEYEATHGLSGEGWGVISTEQIIYTLVVVNEDMEVCGCSSYTTIEAARKELKADHDRLKETLKAEGWEDDDLGEDELNDDTYWVEYGESSYYAEIRESVLVDE